MVNYQIRSRHIRSPRVLDAMRDVPRHWFIPHSHRSAAYRDHAVSIGHGQTISQPYIVALMTDALEVEEGHRVLEVGTGSGYQAAVLSELTPHVYSIEIVKPLAERVRKTFAERGYDPISTRCGDGYFGWEQHGPYDAIIVTCAASHVPPPLVQQLKPGGKMCIPVGGPYSTQRLILITKREDGLTESRNLLHVRFVPMTGEVEKKRHR